MERSLVRRDDIISGTTWREMDKSNNHRDIEATATTTLGGTTDYCHAPIFASKVGRVAPLNMMSATSSGLIATGKWAEKPSQEPTVSIT